LFKIPSFNHLLDSLLAQPYLLIALLLSTSLLTLLTTLFHRPLLLHHPSSTLPFVDLLTHLLVPAAYLLVLNDHTSVNLLDLSVLLLSILGYAVIY
jgi:hypothetical protein